MTVPSAAPSAGATAPDTPAGARAHQPATGTDAAHEPAPSAHAAHEPGPGTHGADAVAPSGEPPATSAPPARGARRGRRIVARVALGLLVVLALLATAAAVHLFRTSQAWERRAADYLGSARDLGEDLAANRAELAGAESELTAVRTQLTTAQERIVQLADEKARLGDDREAQSQLVDYQQRVTEAAGKVALALDQCVQGQDKLIGYLKEADRYDPAELEKYGADVQALCRTATEANAALQQELSR